MEKTAYWQSFFMYSRQRANIYVSIVFFLIYKLFMYYGITDIVAFTLGTIAMVLLLGPNSLYVTNITIERSIHAGYRGVAGIFWVIYS